MALDYLSPPPLPIVEARTQANVNDLQDDMDLKHDDEQLGLHDDLEDESTPGQDSGMDSPYSLGSNSVYSFREASEGDIQDAKYLLLHCHQFNKVGRMITKISRVKKTPDLVVDKAQCERSIREFLTKFKDSPSCFNKTERQYIKCNCLSKLHGLDQAVVYLAAVAQMKKKEQDALYKELINGRRHRSAGYKLRIGAKR
jgi:hypothetical protein